MGAPDRVAQCGCISRCIAQAAWELRSVPMTLGNARMTQARHDPGSGMGGSCTQRMRRRISDGKRARATRTLTTRNLTECTGG